MYQFYTELEGLAAPHATLIVRDYVREEHFVDVRLRFDDLEVLELPPCLSKRSLYDRLLHERGWKFKYSARSKVIERICLDGEEQQVPSWTSFRNYWKRTFPKLVISRRRADVCGDCWVFAN
jgi:hypothetical protein